MRPDKDDLLNGPKPLTVRIADLLLLVVDDAVTINDAALWLEELVKPVRGPVIPAKFTRYDNEIDEILDSECNECRKKYRLVELRATTIEVQCDCGPSEFSLEPPNEMDEAAIHY